MPRTPAPLPDALGPRFSVADAARMHVSRRRLRARDLDAPFHGARRVAGSDDTAVADGPLAIDRARRARVLSEAQTYATVMTEGSFFCGRTAALLFGMPIDHGEELEVGVIAPRRAPRGRGIRGRRVAEHFVTVTTHLDLPVSSPAATWSMLGRTLRERELIVLGDALVRIPRDESGRRRPADAVATVDQLRASLVPGPRPGSRRATAALDRIRVGSSSPLETEFRLDAATGGLPHSALDAEIRQGGRLLGISEFSFPRFRVAVEIEGDHHRTSKAQWDRDLQKYRDYADAGWEVVRLSARNIRGAHPDGVAIVRRALIRRGWDGDPAPAGR